jgi:hypothetical protein
MPTIEDVRQAHEWFEEYEPRALFYRAATELLRLAVEEDQKSPLSSAEAVAVLLRTWNEAFYRFKKKTFNKDHLAAIEGLLADHKPMLEGFRQRSIGTLRDDDAPAVKSMFGKFEAELGTVGAAKCLHLLAPSFFPLWDRAIAERGYGFALTKAGENAENYWKFMNFTGEQCQRLGCELGPNPLKALDEYNYWKYSRRDSSASAAGREANAP